MVQLTRNQAILAKLETSYRTDPTPTAGANAIAVIDMTITEQSPPVERQAQVGNLSNLPSLLGERFVDITFKVEMLGSGTAGTAPRSGALLLACAMDETIVSNTSVTYDPISTSLSSITIWAYIGGRVHKVTGCVGSVKAVCEAGQFMIYEFNFQGYRSANPSVASIPSLTLDVTTAICKNGTLSWDSRTTLVGKTFEWDMVNTIAKRPDLSDANAIAGFQVTDRKPTFSFDPETQIETSYDFRGDALTNQRELSYTVGAFFTATIAKANPFEPEYTDDSGILRDKVSGEMAQDSGDDEISLEYTG